MNKKKILICVDMQKDFVDGALANAEAAGIVPTVVKVISDFDGEVYATRDTHFADYMDTYEGKNLPVPHCIKGTDGWEYNALVGAALNAKNATYVDKITFGYTEWAKVLLGASSEAQDAIAALGAANIESITLIGTCTDICVISNALVLRALFPGVKIVVISDACAGLTKEKHEAALEVMRSTQITVV